MKTTANYKTMKESLEGLLSNFEVLSGNEMGHINTLTIAIENAQTLLDQLKLAKAGHREPFFCYPSASEYFEENE
jgi:hypothetical protein